MATEMKNSQAERRTPNAELRNAERKQFEQPSIRSGDRLKNNFYAFMVYAAQSAPIWITSPTIPKPMRPVSTGMDCQWAQQFIAASTHAKWILAKRKVGRLPALATIANICISRLCLALPQIKKKQKNPANKDNHFQFHTGRVEYKDYLDSSRYESCI